MLWIWSSKNQEPEEIRFAIRKWEKASSVCNMKERSLRVWSEPARWVQGAFLIREEDIEGWPMARENEEL